MARGNQGDGLKAHGKPRTKTVALGRRKAPARSLNALVFESALAVAREIGARAVFLYADTARDLALDRCKGKMPEIILVCRKTAEEESTPVPNAIEQPFRSIEVPGVDLSRMGQIKMTLLVAHSRGLLEKGDTVVCLSGLSRRGSLDTMVVMELGEEYEVLQTGEIANLLEDVQVEVFHRVIELATDLSARGREGRPVGALFVIGDHERVATFCRQLVINPFRGYPEEECSVLRPDLLETIREFSAIDGAFILSGKGTVVSAGTFVGSAIEEKRHEHTKGLGARHAAAAAITSNTRAVAVTLSESTGVIRVYRSGEAVAEIEKPRSDTAQK